MADRAPQSPTHNGAEVAEVPAVIKSVDMSEEMQKVAVKIAADALAKYTVEKDAAMIIKKEFDRLYSTTWHCVVGKHVWVSSGSPPQFDALADGYGIADASFGSFVTHETKNFIYFYLGPIAILLWKTS